ncbi:hypothetical protein B5E56_08445 [Flavonifractor sp. An112]|nr:hypothetical protein B5E56_08445 [Flavonifractor sp. An112]
MKKRLLAICLALCMIVGLLPTTAIAAPEGDGTGLTADDPMVVPEEALTISGTILEEISQEWLNTNKPQDGSTLYLKLEVSDSITELGDGYGGFRLGSGYSLQMDFSNATSLKKINSQAFMRATALQGVLDLSNTKVETIEKSAFSGCTGLTGVILPQTLEVLGTSNGSSGSVFNGCTGLEFVRTAGGSETADFELPSGLKVIGKQTFKSAFTPSASIVGSIPASVDIVGSEAFYSSAFSQLTLEREVKDGSFTGYASNAFKYGNNGLLIYKNAEAATHDSSFSSGFNYAKEAFPVTLHFIDADGIEIRTAQKLFNVSIAYELDVASGRWNKTAGYVLPDAGSAAIPGYDNGWQIEGSSKLLTSTSNVVGTIKDDLNVTVTGSTVLSKPTVEYMVNGGVVKDAGSGVPDLTVTVDQENPGTVGVQVTHPLATEEAKESGTYVYFKYCWWDEKDDGVNGPRSETEPKLFSTATNSSNYNRVFTDNNEIPIRNTSDIRADGDYYLVEIFGYYVENNGTAKRFYKSGHNFIAGDNATDRSYVMNVDVEDITPITITPADITIYTGGEGYTGVVDGEGQTTTTANGMPEPGYFITLPDWMNEELGGYANAENLSDKLVLTYDDGNGDKKEWNLSLYGTTAHSTDVAGVEAARYIYRIVPGEGTGNIPVRLKLTDQITDEIITSDQFTPNSNEQYKAYDMSIYTDEVTADKVTAKITINGQTYTCKVEGTEGQLVIRGLTSENITTDIVAAESGLNSSNISAVLPKGGVTYYINGSNVELSDTDGVKLLVDEVLDDGVLKAYIQENMTGKIPAGDYVYKQQYLDLVDTKNGNAYLSLGENEKLSIYWPVPDDFDTSKDFYVVHFDALDRNYNNLGDELSKNGPDVLDAELVTVNDKQYIQFETGSFSPFVLVYEQEIINSHTYTLRYNTNGGQQIQSESKSRSWVKAYDELPVPVREGYIFKGWYLDSSLTNRVEEDVKVNRSSVTLYAKWSLDSADPDNSGVSDWLETEEHRAYLQGYGNGNFGPTDKMTRAEVAQMFYNLLKDQDVPVTVTFTDVPEEAWYRDAVQALASLGIVEGIGNGKFAPERTITRAEFTAIAMRFTNGALDGENIFSDVSEDEWFYEEVVGSIQYGWINGYTDGTFRPYNNIARSEVTAITNRMLGRSADEAFVDSHTDELRQFPDVSKDVWGYYEIMEATNTHDYTKDTDGETWADLG